MDIPKTLVDYLRQAGAVVALTGAGISAESGIPTFREAQTGLWARYDPMELATPQAFQRNPELVWRWYDWRREIISKAEPNLGHFALTSLERKIDRFNLITQNIDGLHRKAGSQNIIELHGNINRFKCSQEGIIVEEWSPTNNLPPPCPHCGAPLRPDVVWFGETLSSLPLEKSFELAGTADILFSIGTSSLVEPAASIPFVAKQRGALLVEVNPNQTPLTFQADYVLNGPAGVVLPNLIDLLK